MQSHRPDESKGFISITHDEANSSHVDDLLKRQMSLRGEPGITRNKDRRFYYQNWFVFSLVAMLAGIAAWGIIEPYFDDLSYVQGQLEQVNLTDNAPGVRAGKQEVQLDFPTRGYLQVRGQKAWLIDQTRSLQPDGSKPLLDASALEPGQSVGIYGEYFQVGSDGITVAVFVDPSPREPAPAKASLSFRQIAARTQASGLTIFALVGGFIGLAIGAIDGIVCRLLRRALIGGAIGFVVGFIGGFISNVLANLAYAPLTQLAMRQEGNSVGMLSTFGFLLQMGGRSLAWGLAGITMGLGQGIALRSRRLFIYGLIGGVIGGVLGGTAFDPVDMILLGGLKPSSHISRMVGIALVGLSVGAMIGIVELLARDAWLRMTAGPLAGKEFLIFKDVMNIGSSPRSDIYLFNDPEVAELHATIRAVGDECEIENQNDYPPVLLNGRALKRSRLRHSDEIRIGRTVLVYEKRQR
jgi:hypothetical protein